MIGFGDPSSHRVVTVRAAKPVLETSPGVDVTLAHDGVAKPVAKVRWANWQQVRYAERLKRGGWQFRDALVEVTGAP
jgi:hypothetical protein